MATSRNLDKGGLIFRINHQALSKKYGCPGYMDQEYNSITLRDHSGSEIISIPIDPIFIRSSNNLEIKIPYDTTIEELLDGDIYLQGSAGCDPAFNVYFSVDPESTDPVNLAKGGWYYINYLPDEDPIVEPSPKGDGINVFYFRNDSCAPCETMENNGTLDNFKSKHPNMKFTQVSTEIPANKNLVTYFNVTTMPTFVYAYKVGNYTYYDSITGVQTADQLSNTLETIVEKGIDTSYIFDMNDLTYYVYIKYNNASYLKDYGGDWEQIMANYIDMEECPELMLFQSTSDSYTSFKPTGFFNDKLLYNIGDKFRYPSIYRMRVVDASFTGIDWESVKWTIADAKENITKLRSNTGLSIVLNDDYSLDVE